MTNKIKTLEIFTYKEFKKVTDIMKTLEKLIIQKIQILEKVTTNNMQDLQIIIGDNTILIDKLQVLEIY